MNARCTVTTLAPAKTLALVVVLGLASVATAHASEPAAAPAPAPAASAAPAATNLPAAPPAAPPSSPPSAQAALQTLLNSQVGRADPSLREVPVASDAGATALAAASGSAASAGGRAVVTAGRGQSLDTLIKQHLATSPLRPEVLRELIRQLNPQAFAPGNQHRLLAGARLQLPTAHDQAQHAFGKVIIASMAAAHAEADDPRGSAAAGSVAAGARKGWVRYP